MFYWLSMFQEWEWEVVDVVLRIFPETLQDKSLILCGKQYLNSICSVLCKMVRVCYKLRGVASECC